MKKIVIVSGIQIINNPRVVKEANLFADAGYEVEVIGAIFDKVSSARIQDLVDNSSWAHIPIVDLSKSTLRVKIDFSIARLKRKIAFFLKDKIKYEHYNQLGYYVKRLYKIAKERRADLYVIHLEQALWVGRELVRDGCKVSFDVEDWYTEDGLPDDQKLRPLRLMKDCESILLNKSVYASTTSKALSKALAEAYHCPAPLVVYNSFPITDRQAIDNQYKDRIDRSVPSITWFSQTIGPGRGLEQLIDSLNEVNLPFELHLRGDDRRGFKKTLLEMASNDLKKKIHFHPQVSQKELLSRLSEHDIGYCGDLSDCPSRDTTITNKMLEYLRAGLVVIASNTLGHQEVQKIVGETVSVFRQKDKDSLAAELVTLLSDSTRLKNLKHNAKDSLENELSWENSSQLLLEKIEQVI